jgi:hypothetical protein
MNTNTRRSATFSETWSGTPNNVNEEYYPSDVQADIDMSIEDIAAMRPEEARKYLSRLWSHAISEKQANRSGGSFFGGQSR